MRTDNLSDGVVSSDNIWLKRDGISTKQIGYRRIDKYIDRIERDR